MTGDIGWSPAAGFADTIGFVVGAIIALLVIVNAVAALLSCLLQFSLMRPTPAKRGQTEIDTASPAREVPFVSVHVPTYDEPADLVIATLQSLAHLVSIDYEVLIIDNNTRDSAKWQPVAAAAAALGARFRFYHFDRVEGAKAGALNLALTLSDARTTHVAVVDADYQVDAVFLDDALTALAQQQCDYVQFPQAYRGVGPEARGVECELGDYFAAFAGGAGRPGSMLPTGTLSVFALDALRAVGGWSSATITEDAEIGVRLQATGRKGLWLARERGTGLLPLDFDGLRKQRARWVAGNVQVLVAALRNRRLQAAPRELVTLIGQLTAWVSLWLLPAAALLVVALWPSMPAAGLVGGIAAATISASALLTAMRMWLAMRGERASARVWAGAVTTKLALTWTAALAWLPVVLRRPLPFHRTLKQIDAGPRARFGALLAASLLFVGAGLLFALRGQLIEVTACALLAAVWPCSRAVDGSLRAAALRNAGLR